jgi:hypothetical protein
MMSEKPSLDVLDRLKRLVAGAAPSAEPWQTTIADAIIEIEKERVIIADLTVMRESYSRLYKQIYGND